MISKKEIRLWLIWFSMLLTLFLMTSCGSLKNKRKIDTVTTTKETGTVKSIRKSDTLSYTILNPIYKDTLITVENRENRSTLYIKYNEQGQQQIAYNCDDIEEIKDFIKESKQDKSEDIKEKETLFKPVFILYIFLGFAFLIFFSRVLKKFGI
jgi:DNA-binding PadR family transcriptional regulator